MPASIVSYNIQHEGNSVYSAVTDAELHDLIVGPVFDIDAKNLHPG